MTNLKEFRDEIDADTGLASKRKLLVVTSIILLAMQFTGAKVLEANTFILKVSFTDSKGLGLFFILAIVFLILRYYNYAKLYQDKLFGFWTKEMLMDDFFYLYNPYENEATGLLSYLEPEEVDSDRYDMQRKTDQQNIGMSHAYICKKKPFSRTVSYSWSNLNDDINVEVEAFKKVCIKCSFNIFKLEAYYQIKSWLTRRETLDLYSPYIIGLFAIFSVVFNDQFKVLLEAIRKLVN